SPPLPPGSSGLVSAYHLQKSPFLVIPGTFTAHGKHPGTFAPGLEGSTVGNLSAHGCYLGSSTSRASADRCCRLRACCYTRLAAQRCRLGPIQRLSAPGTGIPTCRSGTWCQRGACRCERAAQLCWLRGRRVPRRRSKC
ncbi:PA2BS phospholipase, partial [Jacana jacana]|nr:PA2BS phospholipase [Jacana jacana]